MSGIPKSKEEELIKKNEKTDERNGRRGKKLIDNCENYEQKHVRGIGKGNNWEVFILKLNFLAKW